jgi:hypothetical protein
MSTYNPLTERELSLSTSESMATWVSDEDILDEGSAPVQPAATALRLQIPFSLPYRRIYWHMEPRFTGGVPHPDTPPDYYVDCEWLLQRNRRTIANLPASIGYDGSSNYFKPCRAKICTSSQDIVTPEAIELALSQRFSSSIRRVSISPYRITSEGDELVLKIIGAAASGTAVVNLKVWVGVLSSNRPI